MAKKKQANQGVSAFLLAVDDLQKVGLEDSVDYYYQLKSAYDLLEKAKEVAKDDIVKKFRERGIDSLVTPKGIKAVVSMSKGKRFINIAEARKILSAETFLKLCRVSKPAVVLNVQKADEKVMEITGK
jgi:hypothetical protein